MGVREARGTCPRYQLNMHDLGYKKPFITATASRFRIEMTQATFVETSKGQQSIVHEGYIYQKIRQNGERSWWRCKDHSYKGKLWLETQSGQVTATLGEQTLPPPKPGTSICQHCHLIYKKEAMRGGYHKSAIRRWQNCMVSVDVMKQLSICLHFKTLRHPSTTAGFRGSQHCLKHKKRLTSVESGLEQPMRRTSY